MIPIVAIIGAPNVGKSTLFNCLTRSVDALVMDLPGTTRDRNYGEGSVGPVPYIVIDTGGVGFEENSIDDKMSYQSWEAVVEADVVLFLVDGKSGCTSIDSVIAQKLRELQKQTLLVVNKTDGLHEDVAKADFFSLGLGEPIPIAASHSRGINKLAEKFCSLFSTKDIEEENKELADLSQKIKVAIVGKPNVGKSTLVNRLLGDERMVVFDVPGTTRDSIFIPMEKNGQQYVLIDTAGVRRKAKITERLEKYSIIKSLQAIEFSNVVILLIDATTGIVDQDLNLMNFIVESGRCLVIAINKWDNLPVEQKEKIHDTLRRRLHFVSFADQHFISAKHGTGVGNLFGSVLKAYNSAMTDLSTPKVTAMLKSFVEKHEPPVAPGGRRIKLRYAHAGGKNPPRIIIHGNATAKVEIRDTQLKNIYFKHIYQAPNHKTSGVQHEAALIILANILGDQTHGRLHKALVEQQKTAHQAFAYYVGSFIDPYNFTIWAIPVNAIDLLSLEAAIEAEVKRLLANGITNEELDVAKKELILEYRYNNDSLNEISDNIGENLAHNYSIEEVKNWLLTIDKVSLEDVNNAAKEVLGKPAKVSSYSYPIIHN